MFAIKPITITEVMMTNNIPEPDSSVGEVEWSAGTFNLGDQRIVSSTHRVYRVVAIPSTTDSPLVGVLADPATWVDIGPTNAWAAFDSINNTRATGADLQYVIEPGTVVTTVAGINISGAETINVTVTSPSMPDDVSIDVPMVDNSMIDDFFDYFFEELITRSEFIVPDLPFYSDTTITVTINGDEVGIGNLIIGKELDFGKANYGTGLSSLNFGKVTESPYGYVTFTPGNKVKLVDFNVTIQTAKVNYVFNQLKQLIDIPTLWYATGNLDDPTLVFGYHRDSRINIAYPSISDCTIQVRELV